MIGLLQRVSEASVTVEKEIIGEIGHGILVLVGVEKGDVWENAKKLADKILSYRIFSDENDKINLNVQQVGGELLLVSQFTLAANTKKGNRPGFDTAMLPEPAEALFDKFCEYLYMQYPYVKTGCFGADMQVKLTNDGPLTFWLQF